MIAPVNRSESRNPPRIPTAREEPGPVARALITREGERALRDELARLRQSLVRSSPSGRSVSTFPPDGRSACESIAPLGRGEAIPYGSTSPRLIA
jgi:hypothetical protein